MYLMVMQLGKNIVDGTWYDILKAHIPGAMIGIFVAFFSSIGLLVGGMFRFSDLPILLTLVLSLLCIYLLSFIFFPIGWLGEIPEFLQNKCSSFLPPRLLGILNKRLRMKPY